MAGVVDSPLGNPTPANIGSVTAYTDFDYDVKIRRADGYYGAHNVDLIDLHPGDASKYSDLTTGWIAGNLTGDLYLQKSSTTGQGGVASLTVDGNAQGDIDVSRASSLTITGEATGNVYCSVTGLLQIGVLSGSFSGSVSDGGSMVITDRIDSPGYFWVWTVAPYGRIDINDINGAADLTFVGSFAGTLDLRSGLDQNQNATFNTLFTGVIDVHGARIDGTLDISPGGTGTIVNGGVVGGVVWLAVGGPAFTGTATFTGVSGGYVKFCGGTLDGTVHITPGHLVGGGIVGSHLESNGVIRINRHILGGASIEIGYDADGDIDIGGILALGSNIDIGGVLNGDICAGNLSPDEPLPENINLACGIGHYGTICREEPLCPTATIDSADPPDGTFDACQPHPPGDCSLNARQGIGSRNQYSGGPEPITITLDPALSGAINHDCWELCETGEEQVEEGCESPGPNAIGCITEVADGVYQIGLIDL